MRRLILVAWLACSACPEAQRKVNGGVVRTDAGEFCDFSKTDYR